MNKVFAILLILLCGCHEKSENLVEQQPVAAAPSLRQLLVEAVRNVERSSGRNDLLQRRQMIAEAALGVLAGHRIEELKTDEAKPGDDLSHISIPLHYPCVRVEAGVIHVHSYNYIWNIFPTAVDGHIQQISKVEATPICLEYVL